jgi:hypothetical protein
MNKTFRLALWSALAITVPALTFARGWIMCDPKTPLGQQFSCDTCFLFMTIQLIIQWVMGLAFTAAVGIIVYNGVMLYFSGGNPGNVTKCWTNIRNVAVGLAIMVLSWLIVNTIVVVFASPSSALQSWFKIKCINIEMPVGPEQPSSTPTQSPLISPNPLLSCVVPGDGTVPVNWSGCITYNGVSNVAQCVLTVGTTEWRLLQSCPRGCAASGTACNP